MISLTHRRRVDSILRSISRQALSISGLHRLHRPDGSHGDRCGERSGAKVGVRFLASDCGNPTRVNGGVQASSYPCNVLTPAET